MPRGAKPGERRGGRSLGTPNKLETEYAHVLKILGCDPLEGMAKMVRDEELDAPIRLKAWAELAKYFHPQKRSVEVSGAGGAQLEIRVRRIEG